MSRRLNKGGKPGGRRHENNKIYANPLPITFPEPPTGIFGLGLSLTAKIQRPLCSGYFDRATRSVWVINRDDSLVLWRGGFFGKGDLSRSEPSWFARQTKKGLTAEQIREKRRIERKQFKLDRAKAIATLAAEAETIFETEGRVIVPAVTGPDIPSGATWKPSPSPAQDPAVSNDPEDQEPENVSPEEDVEHLQLTLQEAFFLLWTLDCLQILDQTTHDALSLQQIWLSFQDAHLSLPIPGAPRIPLQFDNPFLIHYVAYHHYRSLGWVVKGGIKFCVDYLLYKRGPVFAHAEFAVVVCPVYEDPADQDDSVTNLANSVPFSWTWLSTINRVNTQVLKTLVLTYVTIPAKHRLDSGILSSPACLAHYGIKEVVVRRFLPARMRD